MGAGQAIIFLIAKLGRHTHEMLQLCSDVKERSWNFMFTDQIIKVPQN